MSGRVDHPNESTNAMKSKPSKLVLIASYLVIWIAAIVVFWAFAITYAEGAMGYSLTFFWIILPATTLVVSFLIGRNDYWGRGKWAFSIGFGVMYMLAEYATFSMANNLRQGEHAGGFHGACGCRDLSGRHGARVSGLRYQKEEPTPIMSMAGGYL